LGVLSLADVWEAFRLMFLGARLGVREHGESPTGSFEQIMACTGWGGHSSRSVEAEDSVCPKDFHTDLPPHSPGEDAKSYILTIEKLTVPWVRAPFTTGSCCETFFLILHFVLYMQKFNVESGSLTRCSSPSLDSFTSTTHYNINKTTH
jgi:hypothetical protein